MFQNFKSADVRENEDIEGFGYRWDNVDGYTVDTLPGIGPNSSQVVSFKLLSGILNQPKFLPIRYSPLTIELELVNSKLDPILPPGSNMTFSVDNTSDDWQIEDVNLKCDLCTLDNSLDNSYAEHLLSGKSLPINFQTFITSSQSVVGTDFTVNVSRAVSRLKSIFVSMYQPDTNVITSMAHKYWNEFSHPMGLAGNKYNIDHELEYQIQIGSHLYPEYPVQSLAESFAKLKQCIYGSDNHFHAVSIKPSEYRRDKYIIGVDTEKIMGASFTGLNTKAGDLMTIKLKARNPTAIQAAGNNMTGQLHMVLFSDQLMEIRDVGVTVFD
jgi:hypothetical protein